MCLPPELGDSIVVDPEITSRLVGESHTVTLSNSHPSWFVLSRAPVVALSPPICAERAAAGLFLLIYCVPLISAGFECNASVQRSSVQTSSAKEQGSD